MNHHKHLSLALGMAASFVALALAGPVAATSSPGEGAVTVAPGAVAAGAAGVTLHLVFTTTTNGSNAGGSATFSVPSGWPAPQTANPGAAGHVSVVPSTCKQASIASVIGPTVAVSMTCKKGQSFDLAYGPVTAPTLAGIYYFTTASSDHGASLRPIAAQPGITVSAPAVATHFAVSAPSSANAGNALSFTVTALDQSDNVALGYAGTIHFSTSDGAGFIPADSSLTNGTGTFSTTFNTVGSQTVTATDTANASLTGMSNAVSVTALAATHFSVSSAPTATAGVPVSVTVTALDATGKVAAAYSGTVHFTGSDAKGVLPADTTLVNGKGVFAVTFKTAGTETVTAKDTADASISGTSNQVAVSAAVATHFVVSAPASAKLGSWISFTVSALDAFGNLAGGYHGTIHFSTSDPSGVIPADQSLSNGTGVFSTMFNTAGTQTVGAKDTADASIAGTSGAVAVG